MKRILQIVASLRIGGAEKVARDIGMALDPAEYQVHYIVFGDEIGDYEEELIHHGCKVFHWSSPSESYPKYLRSLRELIRCNRYDVVHAHTMFNIGWAMMVSKQCGVPIRIAHAHSALLNGSSKKKLIYETGMRLMILQYATHLLACGIDAGIRLYGGKAFHNRGLCILNGIDTAAFSYRPAVRKKIRNELGLDNAFVIGHVGHLTEVKNQSFLLRLMPEVLKRMPNTKLLMLGEGEDRSMLERIIREMGLDQWVIMTGNVRNVSDYLSAMDVFAFPSLYEGMPLSILEVQANGLPCILSTSVPKDVYQTELIKALSLDQPERWVQAICGAKRQNPEKYADELRRKGLDTQTVMKKYLELYERADRH